VVRDQEQSIGVGKRRIFSVPPRIGVAVRADDGQILDRAVQTAGDLPLGGIARKKPVLIHDDGSSHGVFLLLWCPVSGQLKHGKNRELSPLFYYRSFLTKCFSNRAYSGSGSPISGVT
jgi:hypothetical protein